MGVSDINMQLFVKGSENHVFSTEEDSATVADVLNFVCERDNLPQSEVRLYCAGTPLNNESLLKDLATDSIDVSVGLLGGKVHGSLSRAGKVKGQTPKVEKKEKRKQKTGRAKRRIQYNRRFVNVVATFGKKKGPNS